MGSQSGNRNLNIVYCTLALKYKPKFTCTLSLNQKLPGVISSDADTWYRLINHEVLKLEFNVGQWFIKDDNLLFNSSKRDHIVLFGVPPNFFQMIKHSGRVCAGEGLMRSANLPLLYNLQV
jgi:hypothetical protein